MGRNIQQFVDNPGVASTVSKYGGGYTFQTDTQVQKAIDLAAGINFRSLFFKSANHLHGLRQRLKFFPAYFRCSPPFMNSHIRILGYGQLARRARVAFRSTVRLFGLITTP
jgi:hypothetical protein